MMLTGTNLKFARDHNLRIVLETVRLFGPLARKEIARRTELPLQTVSNITKKLLGADLIMEVDRVQEGRGAPSTLLHVNPNGGYSIGLDLDREHLSGVLVDLRGSVLQRLSRPVQFPTPDEAMELLDVAVNELIQSQGVDRSRVWGVGIGLPGPFGPTKDSDASNVINPAAFPGWVNVPVADSLGKRLQLQVFVENNATAAAIGERWYGQGRHSLSFVYLFFGIGLGGGLVIDGRLYSGFNGNAGEIGLIPMQTQAMGPTTPAESNVGSYFNLHKLSEQLQQDGTVVARPEDLAPLFEQRNETFMKWLEECIGQLVPLVHAIECLIDPQAIFLGGRYPKSVVEYIKMRLDDLLPRTRLVEGLVIPPLVCASAGPDVTALGVATLPLYSLLAPLPDVLMKHASNASADSISSFVHK
jgi:predicted NBD/HSP70 family sugar kinase